MLANCESLSQPVACYIPDDEQGQYDAVKALLAAGYRRPLCLHLPASQPATIRRRRGLERACREVGIEPDHLSHSYMGQGDEHYHDIPAVVLAHIREGKPGFDSVICGNDRIAFMVYQTLLGGVTHSTGRGGSGIRQHGGHWRSVSTAALHSAIAAL